MRPLLLAISFFIVILKNTKAQQSEIKLYSRRYERLNVDEILKSPRLVTNYVECLLNKKPCPPEGKALKRILPEALKTKCGRCWPNQKEGAIKVITALYYNYPKHYDALRAKWDPTGEYHRRFEEYLRDQSFNIINSNSPTAQESVIHQAGTSQVLNRIDLDSSNSYLPVAQTKLHANTQSTPSNSYIPENKYLPPVIIKNPTPPSSQSKPLPNRSPIFNARATRPTESSQKSSQFQTTTLTFNLQPQPILEMAIDPRPTRQDIRTTTQRQITRQPITRRITTAAPTRRWTTTTKVPRPTQDITDEIGNRFGIEDNEVTRRTPRPSATSQIQHQLLPGFTTTTTYEINNPVLNIINRITRKVANTAEFIAGMFIQQPRQDYSRITRARQRNSNNYQNNWYPKNNNIGQNFLRTLFGTRWQ